MTSWTFPLVKNRPVGATLTPRVAKRVGSLLSSTTYREIYLIARRAHADLKIEPGQVTYVG